MVFSTQDVLHDSAEQALADAHEATRGITRFEFHPGFPVDIRHNAKIKREQLGAWVAER